MRSLSGRSTEAVPRARVVLILLLAVSGVLVGLLSMHVLGGSAHTGHDVTPAPVAAQAMVDDELPASASCGAASCEELGLMTIGCVLALLALALLLPLSAARWTVRSSAPPMRSVARVARFAPAPSLIALSISRT